MAKAFRATPSDPPRKQAVIYARVSSKEQEKEGFSIPAQLKLLKEYAAAQGFGIAQEYVDVETAKQTGRAAFRQYDRLSQGAPEHPRHAGREDRPALPKPQGLGDGGRSGCRNPLPQGRCCAVAGVTVLGKVYAR